jgi:phosphoglycerate kinase
MTIPSLNDAGSLRGKRVILRTSLNVPIEDGHVRDQFRLEKALPTIRFLKEAGAKILIIAHLGRAGDSLLPVFEVLTTYEPMSFAHDFESAETHTLLQSMKEGEIVLFENVRKDPREEANDPSFGAELAGLGDIYVNDAFADSHRAHASIVGIPAHIPGFLGLLFSEEVAHLSKALSPEHPSLFLLGGAKFETKRPLLEKCLGVYDHVFVGGALANDFFKAMGYEVGGSLVSNNLAGVFDMLRTHDTLSLPTDLIVSEGGAPGRTTTPETVARNESIMDAGPATIEALKPMIASAKFILWNGPLGNYEAGFNSATEALAKLIAGSSATSIVGGGDTVAAIANLKLEDKFTFLSTGGGAMLDFLALGTLPAIDAIIASHHE